MHPDHPTSTGSAAPSGSAVLQRSEPAAPRGRAGRRVRAADRDRLVDALPRCLWLVLSATLLAACSDSEPTAPGRQPVAHAPPAADATGDQPAAPDLGDEATPPAGAAEDPAKTAKQKARDAIDPAVDARLREICSAAGKHLTRVRIFRVQEFRDWNDELVGSVETEIGHCHGLVVTAEPLIAISPSSCRPDQTGMATLPKSDAAKGMSALRYQIVRNDGTRLDADVADEDVALNLAFLRLSDAGDPPEELRHPLQIGDTRRLGSGERYGAPAFRDILRRGGTIPVLGNMVAGKEDFPRPVLRAFSLAHLVIPVFGGDAAFVGLVNLPPPEEGVPLVRVDPRNNDAPPGRDPAEWNTGIRRPLLMPASEIAPRIASLVAEYEAPVPFSALGVVIRNDGATVRVEEVADGRDGGLRVGDVVLSVDGRATRSVERFFAAFEESLEADVERPTARVRRGDAELDVSLFATG